MGDGGMRVLKAATIIMGVLILVGTAVLIATIIKRSTAPAPEEVGTAALVPTAAPYAASLPVPAGSHLTGIAAVGPLLALSVSGGAQDQVIVVDPRTGQPVGAVMLAPR